MTTNNVSANRGYQLPYATNLLDEDVARLISAINAIDTDVAAALAGLLTKSSTGHGHVINDVAGLQSALDSKANAGGAVSLASLSDVDVAGAAAGQFLRLIGTKWSPAAFDASMVASGVFSASRLPSHLTVAALNAAYAALVHSHAIADVAGLQTALDGKAASSHTHAISAITNLQASLDALAAADTKPGSIMAYAGPSAPTGWLMCNGQNVSRSTYSALFAAIGTNHGAGDGSATFGIPDLRGRVIAGKDDMGGSSAARLNSMASTTLGGSGGSQSHQLSPEELPAHNHLAVAAVNSGSALSSTNYLARTYDGTSNLDYALKGSATAPSVGLTSQTGSNSPHNNVQPTIVLNYIIKA